MMCSVFSVVLQGDRALVGASLDGDRVAAGGDLVAFVEDTSAGTAKVNAYDLAAAPVASAAAAAQGWALLALGAASGCTGFAILGLRAPANTWRRFS